VLTPEEVDRVVDAGARYVVSPGLDTRVVERALERGVAALPGIATATELQRAARIGLTVAKFFPAEAMGGLRTIGAFAGPFPDFGFMPSGGLTEASAAEYLRHPSIVAVSGSWMLPAAAIAAGDLQAVASACRRTVQALRPAPADTHAPEDDA
jgi:2-dehydro-3-deoxyphosphogluconate aldolase/(4S)-4-hydroxy-2-oxoglutarate aldolase